MLRRARENNRALTFRVPDARMSYIFPQGFIALDGASLTIVEVDREQATFRVSFIPETLKRTTFGAKGLGDRVNVEIDSRTRSSSTPWSGSSPRCRSSRDRTSQGSRDIA